MARDFAAEKIAPFADKWDEDHYFPLSGSDQAHGRVGIFRDGDPRRIRRKQHGLAGGHDPDRRDRPGLQFPAGADQYAGPGLRLYHFRYGTEELKQKYIAKLVNAEYLGGFGITEPNAGSDVMSLKSTAEDKGDHWLINGSKTWISNASIADVIIYYAYTDRSAGSRGLSAFVVEPKNFNGISTTDLDKLGSRSSPTGEIYLEDTRVPKENILGKPGDGAKIVFGSLNQTRLSAAAGGVGAGPGLSGLR